jgi:hypothetical protein
MPTTTQVIGARDLPEIRAEMAAWLTDPGQYGGPNTWAAHHETATAIAERRAATEWARSLVVADLYFVGADMARLARSAGLALPSYRLHPEDLPARNGLMFWEAPVTDGYEGGEYTGAPLACATWAVRGNGVDVRMWSTREEWLAYMAPGDERAGIPPLTPAHVRAARQRNPQPIVSMFATHLRFGRTPGWLPSEVGESIAGMSVYELEDRAHALGHLEQAERALVVSWLLMGQTLTRTDTEHAPKSAAKRIARLDPNLLTAVRYVQLRHRGVPSQDPGGEGTGRSLRHRFVVRGHWRNQWYPSRKDHRPIWIDDHLKGPDGAPILDPDKLVNILRR